jgi:hypothetical protein
MVLRETPMSSAMLLVPSDGFFFFRFLMVIQSSTLLTSLLLPGFCRNDSKGWINFQLKNWVKIQRKCLPCFRVLRGLIM